MGAVCSIASSALVILSPNLMVYLGKFVLKIPPGKATGNKNANNISKRKGLPNPRNT